MTTGRCMALNFAIQLIEFWYKVDYFLSKHFLTYIFGGMYINSLVAPYSITAVSADLGQAHRRIIQY